MVQEAAMSTTTSGVGKTFHGATLLRRSKGENILTLMWLKSMGGNTLGTILTDPKAIM